ncbi:MAG: CPBP family intramembrane metalloprotease [Bacteroidota bacterium]|nr:CPBP family intramembrane metalloprotease [Bacteroidota bacterium]MDO9614065.1 CPBP family intramembrane metalloprotease [Bacteroidota bacterium]
MNDISDKTEWLLFTSAIAVATVGFLSYYYLSTSGKVISLLKTETGKPIYVLYQRLLGVVIFGFLPLAVILISGTKKLSDFGVVRPDSEFYFWTMILSLVIVPVSYFNSRTKENLKMYPQIREKEWSIGMLIISALSWIAYLLAYEFLFRGFLFFAALPVLGLFFAIVLNTIIYALVHLHKGFKEIIGSVPLGIILCYLTYLTGTIWVAVFLHIVLALSSEWFSLWAHPNMVVKTKWI